MKIRGVLKTLHAAIFCSGLLLLSAVGTAFTGWPWSWYRWMAIPGESAKPPPDMIVMMGGGGIPSESGLIRAWKTAEAAKRYPSAKVIVAMPREESETETHGIEYELNLRGVAASRIVRESIGRNTREQALHVFKLAGAGTNSSGVRVGLVTSPEHMRRTWGAFQKAGFTRLIAIPAWPEAINADLRYDESEIGDRTLGGAVGRNTTLRYRLWDNLGILVKCVRESFAIAYYRLFGWM